MHVALILDAERLASERVMLNRLAVGLIGEGLRVTRIVPEPLDETLEAAEQRLALVTRLRAPMRVLPWVRRERASRLVESLEPDVPEVLYAIGESAWSVGLDLGREIDRPVAIDVWSAAQVRRVPRGRSARHVGAYVAASAPIAEALRERVDPGLVCHVPPGVPIPGEPRAVLADPERALALAVIGSGRDVPSYRAMLGGMSRAVRELPQAHVFLELTGPNEHEIWRLARHLGLFETISAIADASQHRALFLQCDLFLMPEQYGEVRSLTLEAMAAGIPVIAAADPFLDMLIDDVSAVLVDEPDAEAWARQLRRLLSDPEAARRLGAGGRKRTQDHHRSSDHASRVRRTCEQIARGGAYPFAERGL